MGRFEGHCALVTGASKGIGRSIAEAFLAEGAEVVNLSRQPLELENDKLTSYACNLSDPNSSREAAAEIAAKHNVDILVNNAGVVRNTFLEGISDDEFDTLNNLHLRAAIILAQAVTPGMEARGMGRIVNMSSRGVLGLQQRTVYAGTKAAIMAMTRTWALELGPKGITVNAIAPGIVMTDMVRTDIPEESDTAAKIAASLPRRRLGKPEDIAKATLFFCDPENDWVTGQTLFVCGGASLGSLTLL